MTKLNLLFNNNDINLRLGKKQVSWLIITYLLFPQILYLVYFIIIDMVLGMNIPDSTYGLDTIVTLITMSLMLLILRKHIPKILEGFKDIKIYTLALKLYLVIMVLNIIMGLFITEQGANQEAINNMIQDSPYTQFIAVVIFAPIMEEIIFRFVIFRSLLHKNRILAYVVSSLIFGSVHLIMSVFQGSLAQDIVLLPVYTMLGAVFAFAYDYTGKLSAPIVAHMLTNLVAFLPMILL
jgi:membrane protease YdiL (CAAX protease family)